MSAACLVSPGQGDQATQFGDRKQSGPTAAPCAFLNSGYGPGPGWWRVRRGHRVSSSRRCCDDTRPAPRLAAPWVYRSRCASGTPYRNGMKTSAFAANCAGRNEMPIGAGSHPPSYGQLEPTTRRQAPARLGPLPWRRLQTCFTEPCTGKQATASLSGLQRGFVDARLAAREHSAGQGVRRCLCRPINRFA